MDCESLEKMLARGQDNLLLRFGLGGEYVRNQDYARAIPHLEKALSFDPKHAAAWKLLALSYKETGRIDEARKAYEEGINVASAGGHLQAVKEMTVFLKRLNKTETP